MKTEPSEFMCRKQKQMSGNLKWTFVSLSRTLTITVTGNLFPQASTEEKETVKLLR